MTPSNPSNQQPLIYRIADALGVFHLVAPVDHTHIQSEVSGLETALAAKANAVPAGSPSGGIVIASTSGELARSNKTLNDFMPATTVDSTPTTNSDNLVTSGGVAAALAAKMDNKTIDSTPTANSTNLVTSGGVKTALDGKADYEHTHTPIQVVGLVPTFIESDGSAIDMDDLIDDEVGMKRFIIKNASNGDISFGNLLTSGTLPVHPNANDSTKVEPDHFALVTIYKINKDMNPDDQHDHDLCYFVTLDGIFDNI